MSQFHVHRNPGRNASVIPYVVVVQSAAFDRHARRLVIPLLVADGIGAKIKVPYSDATPIVVVNDQELLLNPFEMASVPTDKLGPKIGSLASSESAIITALDEVFSRAYG